MAGGFHGSLAPQREHQGQKKTPPPVQAREERGMWLVSSRRLIGCLYYMYLFNEAEVPV